MSFFFFSSRRRHTRSLRDWSSDVCSSDLDAVFIVHLYEEHGIACVKKLRGMFALAVWDQRRETLLLARDRFGEKPLYYAVDGARLLFGSEIKTILAAAPALEIGRAHV